MIELKKAEPQDCGAIHAMQVEARSEEHTSNSSHRSLSRMPSSA